MEAAFCHLRLWAPCDHQHGATTAALQIFPSIFKHTAPARISWGQGEVSVPARCTDPAAVQEPAARITNEDHNDYTMINATDQYDLAQMIPRKKVAAHLSSGFGAKTSSSTAA